MKNPKVLIAAAEGLPFVKTGGLADVVGALPKALRELGMDVAVMLPKHAAVKNNYQDKLELVATMTLQIGWRHQYMGIETLELNGIRYYFIDNEYYFDGPVYKGGGAEAEQYMFFCRAILEALPYIDFKPDIIHANDWHTGMIPMLLKTQYQEREQGKLKTVFTIHNLQYQGQMGFETLREMLGVPEQYYTPEYLEAWGCANMMKAALVFTDWITTVSPTYAKEIMYPYYARGMEGILQARRGQLTGIVNGIDTVEFDPASDPHIVKNYTVETMQAKSDNKRALIKEMDMGMRLTTPVFGMVTRMTEQKGLDLVQTILEEVLQEDIAFIILGSGDRKYESFFDYIAAKYPEKTGVYIGYSEALGRRIYAGCDFFLMPSQFEPCGISQMIAQRYGTLPVVRKTGGLVDTVLPYDPITKEGDGFAFDNFNAHELMDTMRLAAKVYRNKQVLKKLRTHAMEKDNDFMKSAKEYQKIYQSL